MVRGWFVRPATRPRSPVASHHDARCAGCSPHPRRIARNAIVHRDYRLVNTTFMADRKEGAGALRVREWAARDFTGTAGPQKLTRTVSMPWFCHSERKVRNSVTPWARMLPSTVSMTKTGLGISLSPWLGARGWLSPLWGRCLGVPRGGRRR
jgi:hypothetical protein